MGKRSSPLLGCLEEQGPAPASATNCSSWDTGQYPALVGPVECLCLELMAGWGGYAWWLPQAGLCCPQV